MQALIALFNTVKNHLTIPASFIEKVLVGLQKENEKTEQFKELCEAAKKGSDVINKGSEDFNKTIGEYLANLEKEEDHA